MPLFYVKIRKNIDICNYLPIYYPAICRGWGTFSVPSKKAEPTTVAMAFCVYIILYYVLLQVTPSANRNSYRVATPYYIYTQGRGAAHLNPGLRNRNSYRVAATCEPSTHSIRSRNHDEDAVYQGTMHQQTRQPETRRYCTSLGLLFYFSYSRLLRCISGYHFSTRIGRTKVVPGFRQI